MWCIPKVTPEFINAMEHVLDLYAKPYDPKEPVVCFDEKSKQLLKDARAAQGAKEGRVRRRDYEYIRNGTRNLFLAVEPKGGWRNVTVTKTRKRKDFAQEIWHIARLPRYAKASTIHIVLDNLNTHSEKSLFEAFPKKKAEAICKRVKFHHTPKHASWLNMAEIELSIVERQCTKGRIPDEESLVKRTNRWQEDRNNAHALINWKFTKEDARKVFKYSPLTNLS